MALALLIGAHVVAAQSSDEAAIEQAVEAFRNAMNYTPWMAMNHRHQTWPRVHMWGHRHFW
jgi:hypothetical protein